MSIPSSLRNATSIDFSNNNFDAFCSSVLLSVRTKGKTYLLLEGQYDAKVLKHFFDIKIISIPCHGRGNVVKVFNRLPKTIVNIFGIADRDYDLIPYTDFRLFFYDCNNFEMMLVKDGDVFENTSLFNNNGISSIFTAGDLRGIRNNILFHLFPISIFRKINMQVIPEQNRVAVSDVYPSLAMCMSNSRDNVVNIIKSNALSCLRGLDSNKLSNIISAYDSCVANDSINLYDITHGHDFAELFKLEIGINSDQDFYDIFKKAYKKELFAKTDLYNKLNQFAFLQMIKIFS